MHKCNASFQMQLFRQSWSENDMEVRTEDAGNKISLRCFVFILSFWIVTFNWNSRVFRHQPYSGRSAKYMLNNLWNLTFEVEVSKDKR